MAKNEMKIRCLITDLELKKDKNQADYWIIRVQIDKFTNKSYLAFSGDYSLYPKTKQLLVNYPHQLVNNWAVLTVKKKGEKEKVINLEIEK